MFERNEQEISQILEKNLEGVLSGKTSMDEVLRRHPQHAAGLRRELEAVLWLHSRSEEVKSRPGFVNASRMRVVERIKQEAHNRGGKHAVLSFNWPQQRRVFQWAAVLFVLLLFLSGAGGLVSFAQNTIPGQQLYGVKRTSEKVALGLTADTINRAELSLQITDRRFQEVEALIGSGEMSYVEPTLADFNEGVKQSVALLQQVNNSMPTEKLVLAQRLTEDLGAKAERLAILADNVPTGYEEELIQARDLTLSSVASSMVVMEEMNELLGTSTPTGTATPEPTITLTATVVPSKTPKLLLEKPEEKQEIDKTPPGLENKPPTLTPRPTNPNRPTRQPTKVPLPKEDKPTKDDRPTKTDKKDK